MKKKKKFWWDDENCPTDLSESYFVELFSVDNFLDREVIQSYKIYQTQYSDQNITLFFLRNFYFLDPIKWLSVSLQLENTLTETKL